MADLRALGDLRASVAEILSRQLLAQLSKVQGLAAFSPSDVAAMFDAEKVRDLAGCDAVACMAEIGGGLGADLVLYGAVGSLGSRYSIDVSIVNSADATVLVRASRFVPGNEDALADALPGLIREIADALNSQFEKDATVTEN